MHEDTSLLRKLRERLQEVPTEAYGSMGMADAVRDFRDSVIDHIDDLLHEHDTAKARSPDWIRAQSLDAPESPGYQESQNTCGKIDGAQVGTAPLKIAVDCSIERVLGT